MELTSIALPKAVEGNTGDPTPMVEDSFQEDGWGATKRGNMTSPHYAATRDAEIGNDPG
jgi:hypothetical protein